LPAHPEREERYRRAHEFLEVVTKLWDGWEPDAIVVDKESGRYADPAAIHPADHHGEFFDVAGPLPGPPGPQGRPVLVQAGGSEGGLSLAGRYADVVFTVAQTKSKAVAFRDDIRARAVAAGRRPDDVKISLGVIVLIGTDEADAAARAQELYTTLDTDTLARGVLAGLGLPADHDLDAPIRLDELTDIAAAGAFSVGGLVSTRSLIAEEAVSARDIVRRSAGNGAGHRLVIGSPERIADDLQAWFEAGTADGFTVMYADTTVDFERFARLVVPILIERGLFRPAEVGSTLRDRLGLPYPDQRRRKQEHRTA
jgi:FMN-dependent oxidoreductase (nitrilotriacetate monooxygenase family)